MAVEKLNRKNVGWRQYRRRARDRLSLGMGWSKGPLAAPRYWAVGWEDIRLKI